MGSEQSKNKIQRLLKKFLNNLDWRNSSLGRKYLSSFGIAALLFLISGTIVFIQLSVASNDIDKFEEDTLKTQDMFQMASLIHTKDIQIADFMLTKDHKFITNYEETVDHFEELKAKVEPNLHTKEQKNLYELVVENDDLLNETFENIIEDPDADVMKMTYMRNESNSHRAYIVEAINQLVNLTTEEQFSTMENAKSSLDNSMIILIVANMVAIGLGVLIMVLINRSIVANLHKVVGITSEVANGNLAVNAMDYKSNDEVGQLAHAMNQMKKNIKSIIVKVSDASQAVTSRSEELTQAANEVNEGGEQIASTMQELSSGAETQANSAGDLSEGMNDFVGMVQFSDQEGQEITKVSNNVRNLTSEGTKLMKDSVEQMKRIDLIVSEAVEQVQGLDKQSAEISQLVLVIKNIADQTNLLSLNAAIEAARAGEHGRGFAVVADEVRKLAEQVTESVSEITHIVENIQGGTSQVVNSLNKGYEEVKEGTEQIEKTGHSFYTIDLSVTDMIEKIMSISNNLKNIAENSDHMNDLIQDIASVSEESAAGVEQAAATVQETSSSMDEISNSAEELAKLAEQLNDEIRVFKME